MTTVGTIPEHVHVQAGHYEDMATQWLQRDPDRFHPDVLRAGNETIEAARWLTEWFAALPVIALSWPPGKRLPRRS